MKNYLFHTMHNVNLEYVSFENIKIVLVLDLGKTVVFQYQQYYSE